MVDEPQRTGIGLGSRGGELAGEPLRDGLCVKERRKPAQRAGGSLAEPLPDRLLALPPPQLSPAHCLYKPEGAAVCAREGGGGPPWLHRSALQPAERRFSTADSSSSFSTTDSARRPRAESRDFSTADSGQARREGPPHPRAPPRGRPGARLHRLPPTHSSASRLSLHSLQSSLALPTPLSSRGGGQRHHRRSVLGLRHPPPPRIKAGGVSRKRRWLYLEEKMHR